MQRNTVLLLVGRLVSAATTLIVLAVVSRLRGAEALGLVGVGFAAGSIAATAADLGLSSLLIREVARDAAVAPWYLGGGLAVRCATVPMSLVAVWVVALLVAPSAPGTVLLVSAGLVVQQVAESTRSIFIARSRMGIASAHQVIENLVWLAFVTLALMAGAPMDVAFGIALLVWAGSLAAGVLLASGILAIRPSIPTGAQMRGILVAGRPFAGFALVGATYSRIDPLLIGLFAAGSGLSAAGEFFAATRLLAAFEYLPDAVSRAAYPDLSRRVAAGGDLAPVLSRAVPTLLAAGAVAPVVLVPASAFVLSLLLGGQGPTLFWLLGALSFAVPIRFLGYLYGVTLTSADSQTRRLAAGGLALVAVVGVDMIGLPRVGIVAAVVGNLLSSTLVCVVYARFVHRRFGTIGIDIATIGGVVVAALVAIAAGLATRMFSPDPVGAVVAAAVYGVLTLVGPARSAILAVMRAEAGP